MHMIWLSHSIAQSSAFNQNVVNWEFIYIHLKALWPDEWEGFIPFSAQCLRAVIWLSSAHQRKDLPTEHKERGKFLVLQLGYGRFEIPKAFQNDQTEMLIKKGSLRSKIHGRKQNQSWWFFFLLAIYTSFLTQSIQTECDFANGLSLISHLPISNRATDSSLALQIFSPGTAPMVRKHFRRQRSKLISL